MTKTTGKCITWCNLSCRLQPKMLSLHLQHKFEINGEIIRMRVMGAVLGSENLEWNETSCLFCPKGESSLTISAYLYLQSLHLVTTECLWYCIVIIVNIEMTFLVWLHVTNWHVYTFVQYERQLAEYQEKTSRLQRRLTQAEQRATTATQQVCVITFCVLCRYVVTLTWCEWFIWLECCYLSVVLFSFLCIQLTMLASQRRKTAIVDQETA